MRLEYFHLIDRVTDLDVPGRKISAEAVVPLTSPVFEGHFPGFPLMPGVLLIETMAQASGWLLVAKHNYLRMPFLAAVKEAKFRTFVTPGSRLVATANLAHDGSGYAITEARVTFEGKTVCDASITFRVLEFPNAEFERQMRGRAIEIGMPVPEAVGDG